MPAARVGPRLLADEEAVVNVPPMLRRGIRGIDAECLDEIDRLQDFLDFRPTGDVQETFPARDDVGHGRVALAWSDGAQDVDAREDGSVVIGGPANESEDAAESK